MYYSYQKCHFLYVGLLTRPVHRSSVQHSAAEQHSQMLSLNIIFLSVANCGLQVYKVQRRRKIKESWRSCWQKIRISHRPRLEVLTMLGNAQNSLYICIIFKLSVYLLLPLDMVCLLFLSFATLPSCILNVSQMQSFLLFMYLSGPFNVFVYFSL